jgi:hypothetical protein
MRYFTLVVLLVAAVPAWASGPKAVVKAEPKPQFDGIHHKNFNGNVIGLQLPAQPPAPPIPFITSRELIALLCPDVEIASRLFGFELPRSGFSNSTTEILESVRDAILPTRGVGQALFDGLERLPQRR